LANHCIEDDALDLGPGSLYVKRSESLGQSNKIPVVILHGFSFTSDVWVEIGLLQALCKKDIPFIAPDMPYGMRVKRSFKSRDPGRNVEALIEALKVLGLSYVYMVGASLGGYIALRYTVTRKKAVGMTLIAPVNSLEESITAYFKRNPIPIQVIYGSKDDIVSRSEIEEFVRLVGGELVVYENAPHPAYLKYPERFIDDVVNHYNRVASKAM